jgi:hypothetical protein
MGKLFVTLITFDPVSGQIPMGTKLCYTGTVN